MTQDLQEFRELLNQAIGVDKKKGEFAIEADISASHLSRMLNAKRITPPSIPTLKKIANASCGRVTLKSLLVSCGYPETEDPKAAPPYMVFGQLEYPEIRTEIQNFKKGMAQFNGIATRYDSIEDVLETVSMLYSKKSLKYNVEPGKEYKGRGHMNAEEVANVTISWATDEYACELGMVVYFCETKRGGIVLSDSAFDLPSLVETEHPLGMKKLYELSEVEGVVLTDYQTVFDYKNL